MMRKLTFLSEPESSSSPNRDRLTEGYTMSKISELHHVQKQLFAPSTKTSMRCPDQNVYPWQMEEDIKIAELVSQYGETHWSFVAKYLPGRTGKQCRERYENFVKTNMDAISSQEFDDYDQPMKRRIEYVSPPFARYGNSCTIPSSTKYSYQKDLQYTHIVEVSDHHYKTVYPATEPTASRGSNSIPNYYSSTEAGIYKSVDILNTCGNNNQVTPKKSYSEQTSVGFTKYEDHSVLFIDQAGIVPSPPDATKPGILRRKRRLSEQENQIPLFLPVEHIDSEVTKPSVINNPSTPLKTPVKSLPFSPSQFFTSPYGANTSQAITSTPVCSKKSAIDVDIHGVPTTPDLSATQTPTVKQSQTSQPQTPTPFKNAMAELERRSGVIHIDHYTPTHIHDDLQDVIARDTARLAFQTNLSHRFGSYKVIRNASSVQQNLDKKLTRDSLVVNPETPSKSLRDDVSLAYSPPSIFKETLSCSPNVKEFSEVPHSPPSHKMRLPGSKQGLQTVVQQSGINFAKKSGFMMIACGKTEDQKIMTNLAKSWMRLNDNYSLHVS